MSIKNKKSESVDERLQRLQDEAHDKASDEENDKIVDLPDIEDRRAGARLRGRIHPREDEE